MKYASSTADFSRKVSKPVNLAHYSVDGMQCHHSMHAMKYASSAADFSRKVSKPVITWRSTPSMARVSTTVEFNRATTSRQNQKAFQNTEDPRPIQNFYCIETLSALSEIQLRTLALLS